jgi:hypothetical protein
MSSMPNYVIVRSVIAAVVFGAITVFTLAYIIAQGVDYATSQHVSGAVSKCESRKSAETGSETETCFVSYRLDRGARQHAAVEQPLVFEVGESSEVDLWVTSGGHVRIGGWRAFGQAVPLLVLSSLLAVPAGPGLAILLEVMSGRERPHPTV